MTKSLFFCPLQDDSGLETSESMSQEEATDLSREGHSLYSMWEDNSKGRSEVEAWEG
jgi:hypothetical protein